MKARGRVSNYVWRGTSELTAAIKALSSAATNRIRACWLLDSRHLSDLDEVTIQVLGRPSLVGDHICCPFPHRFAENELAGDIIGPPNRLAEAPWVHLDAEQSFRALEARIRKCSVSKCQSEE
jgi:hypothetical protein